MFLLAILTLTSGALGDDSSEVFCPNSTSNWTCDDFAALLQFGGVNLASGLRCLGYERERLPWLFETESDPAIVRHVVVNLKFTHINDFDDQRQIFEPEFWILQLWNEPRLRFPDWCPQRTIEKYAKYHVGSKNVEQLWFPLLDLGGVMQMQTREAFNVDEGGFIDAHGSVGHYKRYIARLSCAMDFSLFPFDEQTCDFELTIRSDDPEATDLPFLSFDDDQVLRTDPADLVLPNWSVAMRARHNLTLLSVMGQPSPGVAVTFTFVRFWTFELMQTFLPSAMILVVSAMSVFVPAQHVPGRMGLCITAFLSMISLFNGAREDWPPTTSLKAVDYWSGMCYLLVFAALLEYSAVLYLKRDEFAGFGMQGAVESERKRTAKFKVGCNKIGRFASPSVCDGRNAALSDRIERVARVMLPASLVVGNAIFWTYICVRKME